MVILALLGVASFVIGKEIIIFLTLFVEETLVEWFVKVSFTLLIYR